eukprot:266236-Hanusia_phi.AAC.4
MGGVLYMEDEVRRAGSRTVTEHPYDAGDCQASLERQEAKAGRSKINKEKLDERARRGQTRSRQPRHVRQEYDRPGNGWVDGLEDSSWQSNSNG